MKKEQTQDYYKILQVDPEADHEVIEAAYKRLARKYHPDLNKSPDANDRMKEINCAYEALGDPKSRAEYHEEWQRTCGARYYARPEFGPLWSSGPKPTVTLEPSVLRFDNVRHGAVVDGEVSLSLSRQGRFQGEMRPLQGWLKAKVAKRRKGSVVIQVTVDTASLRGGVAYEGAVGIYSPMYGTVLIPVHVSVMPEPRPVLRIEPDWLDAGTVRRDAGATTLELTLRNAGDGDLEGEIVVKHGWLAVDRDRFTGDETRITVTLKPATLRPGRSYTGKLEVHSSGGLATVPVKVAVAQELPDLPPPDSDEYWPAVLSYLIPESPWEKDFVGQVRALSRLRGWKPSESQQSTIMSILSRNLDDHGTLGKE